jgi:hypothetical protein
MKIQVGGIVLGRRPRGGAVRYSSYNLAAPPAAIASVPDFRSQVPEFALPRSTCCNLGRVFSPRPSIVVSGFQDHRTFCYQTFIKGIHAAERNGAARNSATAPCVLLKSQSTFSGHAIYLGSLPAQVSLRYDKTSDSHVYS